MEVYIDVLFLENLVMNYLILWTADKFSKMKASQIRLFLGALIGSCFLVLLVIFPGIKVWYSAFAKVLLSLCIVGVSFAPKDIGSFLKNLIVFYISTFIYAGAAFAFLYFNQSGGLIKNGIVYIFWDSKWTVLLLSIVTVIIIIRIFWEVMQQRLVKQKLLVPVGITFEEKKITIQALIDTGNSLYDPLTNIPVVVVEFKAIKELLPKEIWEIYEESKESDLSRITEIISTSKWFSRFRMIPYASLGKENGMLLGFKPDYVEIGEKDEKKGVQQVIIGIYNRSLSQNDLYKALLSPDLI